MKPIYLDYNATTPIDPEVVEAMRPFLDDNWGNPSSSHFYGHSAKAAIEKARGQVAELINCSPDEIVFTSGGSEANNYAIKGFALANRCRGDHIITTQFEHPAVIEVCRFLEKNGFRVTCLPVSEQGLVDLNAYKTAITEKTILTTIMHANNEVGTIQPIKEMVKIAHSKDVAFHTDAAQSTGKIPVDSRELGVDLLSIAGHKLYTHKGIGVLFIRHGIQLEKLIHGASHEKNRRAGTENTLQIVGLGKACEIARRDLEKNRNHSQKMRELLFERIKNCLQNVRRNGHPIHCLPNTLSLSFKHCEATAILNAVPEIAASAGAACHSTTVKLSATLRAMHVPLDYAGGTIRFSVGKFTTETQIKRAADLIVKAVQRCQKIQ